MNTRAVLNEAADELEALGRPVLAARLRAIKLGGRKRHRRIGGYSEREHWLAELHCALADRIAAGECEIDVLREAAEDPQITDHLSSEIVDRFAYLGRLLDLDGFSRLRPLIRNLRTQNQSSPFFVAPRVFSSDH